MSIYETPATADQHTQISPTWSLGAGGGGWGVVPQHQYTERRELRVGIFSFLLPLQKKYACARSTVGICSFVPQSKHGLGVERLSTTTVFERASHIRERDDERKGKTHPHHSTGDVSYARMVSLAHPLNRVQDSVPNHAARVLNERLRNRTCTVAVANSTRSEARILQVSNKFWLVYSRT